MKFTIAIIIIVFALILLGTYLYARYFVNNSPSIIGNDYDKKMNADTKFKCRITRLILRVMRHLNLVPQLVSFHWK